MPVIWHQANKMLTQHFSWKTRQMNMRCKSVNVKSVCAEW